MNTPSALDIVSEYTAALMAQDEQRMKTLRTSDFVLDWVYADALENPPSSAEETHAFWSSWFEGFSEMDYEVS